MSACILWTGYIRKDGYGVFRDPGDEVPKYAHRRAWEEANGPIPEGMDVLHTCDVKCCINVAHMYLGDQTQNVKDAVERGQMLSGDRHPQSKLDWEKVRKIRADSRPLGAISQEYGISKSVTSRIKTGKLWRESHGLPVQV